MTLSELADRVEAATGPDRELDLLIWRVADPVNATKCLDVNCAKPLPWLHLYTSSLDAAATLVPEGYLFMIVNAGGTSSKPVMDRASAMVGMPDCPSDANPVEAATPALALCAAALRARAKP